MPEPLLLTKLYLPSQRPNLVFRPQLINRLNQGLQLGHKLALISAPAGFGKTTLVTEWFHPLTLIPSTSSGQAPQPSKVAWLSLDENDNNLARFLAYFIAALNQIEGVETPVGEETLRMLQSPSPVQIESILTPLINEIAALPDKSILVLDDYHVIDTEAIDNALAYLLDHLPPQLHLAIATREDPNLPLARLRARGQLTELRATDLRFNAAEAADFLSQMLGQALSAEEIAALESRTEGWITGLQLAALSMQGNKDSASFIKSFTGSHRYILDYLIEEVLEQQSESVQTFLLKTAVLNQLSGSLCDAVTGWNNGQATLETLEHANLFIVPLDEERRWYRYHHLFADLLRQKLRQTYLEQIPELHLRASNWFELENSMPDAIRHAFAANDFERAADLAELAWPTWNENLQSITWFGWVKQIPEEIIRTRPVLIVAYVQALLNLGQLEVAETWLLEAERWLESTSESSDQPVGMVVVDEAQYQGFPAWIATTRAYHAQAIGDVDGTVTYGERALDLFPEDDIYNRAALTGLLGLAQWASGDLEASHSMFTNGLFQNIPDRIKGTFILADMQKTLGHLHEAERTCQHGLQLAEEHFEPLSMGTEDVYSALSDIHREQGKLEIAAQDLQQCKLFGDKVELPDWQHRYCIAQARLEMSLGNLDVAVDLLDEALRVYVRTPVPETRPIAAMKARVWVKQGRLNEALAWAHERDLSADDKLSYIREYEHMILVRLLIAQYKKGQVDDFVQKVTSLLARLQEAAEEKRRMGSVLEILVLQALAYEAQSKMDPALVSLERALTLAEPEGYHQLFVDEGSAMMRLLREALSRGIAPNYVRQLLTVFSAGKPQKPKPSNSQLLESELIDSLSERELEVLQLIADGLTNPEIATKLFLTLNTVKVHTRNIYSKLDVHSRTQAVARARDLNILLA